RALEVGDGRVGSPGARQHERVRGDAREPRALQLRTLWVRGRRATVTDRSGVAARTRGGAAVARAERFARQLTSAPACDAACGARAGEIELSAAGQVRRTRVVVQRR